MKKLFYLLTSMVVIILMTGCESESPSEYPVAIEIDETETNISLAEAETHELTFKSTHDWTITVSDTSKVNWCKISAESGKAGDASVKITAEPNNTKYDRSANLVIKSLDKEKTLSVFQPKGAVIDMDELDKLIDMSESAEHTLSFTTTYDWTVSVSDTSKTDWCKISSEGGKAGDALIKITAETNDTKNDRSVDLIIKSKDQEQTIKILQEKVNSIEIKETDKNLDLTTLREHSLTFASTYDWTVSVSDTSKTDWCKVLPVEGKAGESTLEIRTTANETKNDRTVDILIISRNKTETIKVSQQKAVIIEIKEADKKIDMSEKTEYSIPFFSTYEWTASVSAETPADWCKITPAKGKEGSASITLSVTPNKTKENRSVNIIITSKDKKETITVSQERAASIEIKDKDKNIDLTAIRKHSLTFTSTYDWTVSVSDTSKADWCKVLPVEGKAGESTLEIKTTANETKYDRSADILIVSHNKTETIKVSQQKAVIIEIKEADKKIDMSEKTEYSIPFFSTYEWTASVSAETPADWCKITPAKGKEGSASITLSVTANNTKEKRSANIIITSKDKKETITISQKEWTGFNVSIPDEKFKAYCLDNFDTDQDGNISLEEAEVVTEIDCEYNGGSDKYRGIKSLEGIKYFSNLQVLKCGGQELTSLDLSENKELKELFCNSSNLTSLNLNQCRKLIIVSCSYNRLTSLDVSSLPDLKELECDRNELESLNLSNNKKLNTLLCGYNKLGTIDLSACTELVHLSCEGARLTSLDVSSNTVLKTLECSNNNLPTLDLSKNSLLEELTMHYCSLKSINLKNCKKLKDIEIYYNSLTEIDLSDNTALTDILLTGNNLSTLDISKNTLVKRFSCIYNPNLTELWVATGQTFEYMDLESHTIVKYK